MFKQWEGAAGFVPGRGVTMMAMALMRVVGISPGLAVTLSRDWL
jgi:hypothetical protein